MTAPAQPKRPVISSELLEALLGPLAAPAAAGAPAPTINIHLAPGAVLVIGHYAPPAAPAGPGPKGASDA